jgi:hypothetical protein
MLYPVMDLAGTRSRTSRSSQLPPRSTGATALVFPSLSSTAPPTLISSEPFSVSNHPLVSSMQATRTNCRLILSQVTASGGGAATTPDCGARLVAKSVSLCSSSGRSLTGGAAAGTAVAPRTSTPSTRCPRTGSRGEKRAVAASEAARVLTGGASFPKARSSSSSAEPSVQAPEAGDPWPEATFKAAVCHRRTIG